MFFFVFRPLSERHLSLIISHPILKTSGRERNTKLLAKENISNIIIHSKPRGYEIDVLFHGFCTRFADSDLGRMPGDSLPAVMDLIVIGDLWLEREGHSPYSE